MKRKILKTRRILMLHTVIEIKPDFEQRGITHTGDFATLTTYILDYDEDSRGGRKRPLIIICPGGGYGHMSTREAEPVAIKMNSYGYNACVLRYSLSPNNFPCQLMEAAMAVEYAKNHADEWHVDADKICIAGFSAGAHVAGSLGTMWNDEILSSPGKDNSIYRPAAMLLSYPVITAGEFAHRGSFDRLVNGDEKMYPIVSLENRVTDDTVPAFIWHTYQDGTVPVENSLLFTMAMRKRHIPCEFHMFERGIHGISLATENTARPELREVQPECACWPDLFSVWFNNL